MVYFCFVEVIVLEKKNSSSGSSLFGMGYIFELEEVVWFWWGVVEVIFRLRERGCDGCLVGIEV